MIVVVVAGSLESAFPSPGRFWKWFVGSLVVIALLAGLASTFETVWGLHEFGGVEYGPRVAALGALREIGPAAGSGAVIVAMVAWGHRVGPGAVTLHGRGLYARSAIASLAAFPVATILALASSAILLLFHGVTVAQFWDDSVAIARRSDFAFGIGLAGLHGAVALLVGRLGLVPLTHTSLKLGWKILVAWCVVVLVNVLLGAALALAA